jgi:Fe-S-cluster containining protein
MLLGNDDMMRADSFAEDAERIRRLPANVIAELREYLKELLSGNEREDQACLWLDRETMRCRYHALRPSFCRDFEVGSDDCLDVRDQFEIE